MNIAVVAILAAGLLALQLPRIAPDDDSRFVVLKEFVSPVNGEVFFAPSGDSTKGPDGMTIDSSGNLYLTGLGGVWVVSPQGKVLTFIEVPEFCSNVTFGGADGSVLYITCSKRVYSLQTNSRGGRGASGRYAIEDK